MSEITNFSETVDEQPAEHPRIILDVHTHHPAPQPEGIVALDPTLLPEEGRYPSQFYSVGLHPWTLQGIAGADTERMASLKTAAERADVLAIGETGIDTVHPGGAPLAGQMNAFRAHIELSEELGKPLVIHCVKAQDIVIGVKKDMKPTQPWIIHGFRGKPTVLRMLVEQGIYISFGPRFNPAGLIACPAELLLAETDEAPGRIQDVIAALQTVRDDVTPDLLARNMRSIFKEINA